MRLKSWETTEREGEIVTEWVRTEIRVPDSMTPSNYEFRVARATSSSFAFGVRKKIDGRHRPCASFGPEENRSFWGGCVFCSSVMMVSRAWCNIPWEGG